MATTNTKKPRGWRPLFGLSAIILVLFGSIFAGTLRGDATWTPKLALDLEGGTQVILQAVTANNEPVESEDIDQAIEIIRQRVDSSGFTEAEITSQGGQNIVVSLPGKPSQETLDLVRESAQMQFRPVLFFGDPTPVTAEDGQTTTPDAGDEAAVPEETASANPSDDTSAAASDEETTQNDTTDESSDPAVEPTDASDFAQVTEAVLKEFEALDCTNPENLKGGGGVADPNKTLVTCDPDGTTKYILGPMEIPGSDIAQATSGLQQTQQGVTLNNWVVNIEFNAEGTKKFDEVTTRLIGLPPADQWVLMNPPTQAPNMFAMVLDNLVISSPSVNSVISNGQAEISGDFTNESANALASQLNFGALPLTFEVQSEETISATLGSEQLEKGLVAGLIGLLLVVVYSVIQYRVLGLVTVSSLAVAAILTYLAILFLSWQQGYRLSLPGVAGVIVAIGITADSFIVYFERIRDELRDGRSLENAIEVGWERARRTIIASDTVNFLAAIVLYFLAVGGVRGFAFTLGLTTIVDLIVVFLFTHPVMKLLARTKFFAQGHRLSGFNYRSLGVDKPRYVGRGKVVGAGVKPSEQRRNADGSRMTIAQRKAAEQAEREAHLSGTVDSSRSAGADAVSGEGDK
ncbi:protein translocase subunit SecD [Timonella sp. A28]|uniref:protein translocase subunit SecD n=1 Tax=Timonella sp. A28 TaxID=3442640 RepID=UPI003EBE3FEB